jgi:uncharacterized protein (TIGR00730 family)
MKYIAVFCSSRDLDEKYVEAAKEFSRLMVEHGYHLVFGGSDTGLMKVVADEVSKNGGQVIGVSIKVFHHLARKKVDKMFIAKDLGERKFLMLDKAVAIVALVGGMGTLDELIHIAELKRQKNHDKPVVVLNTDNFYKDLKELFNKMEKEGFNNYDTSEYIKFIDTPEETIKYINEKLDK